MIFGNFLRLFSTSLFFILLLCCNLELSQACYNCLIANKDRESLCEHLQVIGKMRNQEDCDEAFRKGFEPLDYTAIPDSQLKDIIIYLKTLDKEVKQIDMMLPPRQWQELFHKKMDEYVNGIKLIASRVSPAACKGPCGLQKMARTFNCLRCIEKDCDVPVDCDIEDIHVKESEQTNINCNVSFPLPDRYEITWKFAKNLRVKDLNYFKFLHKVEGDVNLLIRTTMKRHHGTYVCQIVDDDEDVIVEKFFFVSVSRKDQSEGVYLGKLFKEILRRAGNHSVWAVQQKKEQQENDGRGILGFIESQEPLSTGAVALATLIVFLFSLLIMFSCVACIYCYNNDSYKLLRRKKVSDDPSDNV